MPIQSKEDRVIITHPKNKDTYVEILNSGATVFSWKLDGQDVLWLSDAAKLDGSKPVRGGIPLVFPRFGPPGHHPPTDKLPQHGFARNVTWEFLGSQDDVTAQWGLGPENLSEEFRAAWNYDFTLIYTVKLEDKALITSLEVENTDTKPFEFNVLFHHYLAIPEIEDVAVSGLQGLSFVDKVDDGKIKAASNSEITFSGEVDRQYGNTPSEATVLFKGKPLYITKSSNLTDTVVWNPWDEKASGMSDFYPKSGYHKMVCVEHGSVSKFQSLEPGAKWLGSVTVERA